MLSGHVRPTSTACKSIRLPPRPQTICRSTNHVSLTVSRSYRQPSTSTQHSRPVEFTSRRLSDLGLRSHRPPDTLPDPKDSPPPHPDVPDHEWEIRTGRAIYVIQETLPEFFQTGLITGVNKTTGIPGKPSSPSASINFLEYVAPKDDEEPIYSPNIRLSYTPPVELPSPFPKTFHAEGLQLYLASSSFVRHTMNALYSNLTMKTIKLVVNTPSSISQPSDDGRKKRVNREKTFTLRQIVTGLARVSGKSGEWEIESTYAFSPATGLIQEHMVNSIHPAPHQAIYDSLRLSFGKILGLGHPTATTSNGAACKGNIAGGKGV